MDRPKNTNLTAVLAFALVNLALVNLALVNLALVNLASCGGGNGASNDPPSIDTSASIKKLTKALAEAVKEEITEEIDDVSSENTYGDQ